MGIAETNLATEPGLDEIRTAIPEGKPAWTENICWMMHDPNTGISLYAHLGRMQPDRTVWEGLSLIYLPNGEVLVNRNLGVSLAEARTPEYNYRPVVPNKIWHYHFEGMAQRVKPQDLRRRAVADEPFEHVVYDLVFEGVQPVYNMHGSTLESETTHKTHLEQGGTLKGAIVIGGKRHEINCTAFRDHSVSERTFKTLELESWANCTFPSGRVFSILEVKRQEVQIMQGQVFRDGKIEPLTASGVADLTSTAGEPYTGTIRLQVPSGDVEIQYEVIDKQFVNFNLMRPVGLRPGIDIDNPDFMLAVQCPAKFTWDGEVGYGWLERVRPHKAELL